MLSKAEIEKVNKILSCDNCPTSYACEGCEIMWTDKQLLKKYIDQLELEKDTLRFIQWCDTDRINQLEQENNKQNKIIDEMAKVICMLDTFDNYDTWNNDISEVKQYFEKKVNESNG